MYYRPSSVINYVNSFIIVLEHTKCDVLNTVIVTWCYIYFLIICVVMCSVFCVYVFLLMCIHIDTRPDLHMG